MQNKIEDAAMERPSYAPLAASMKVDFLFNEQGHAWILHDKPLPEILAWVEFDPDLQTLTLVGRSGKMQELGLKVPTIMARQLKSAMEITTMLMKNGRMKDMAIVPIITRHITIN